MKNVTTTEARLTRPAHPFTPELFEFIGELRQNNNREWFSANRARYEDLAVRPMLAFIEAFGARLPELSPQFVADTKPVGGSMFRIYRDTRFSRDKSPYKTHIAAHFRHGAGKDVHAPGFYLHIEPGQCLGGGGIWHPDSTALGKIRERIAAKPGAWRAVLAGDIQLEGESLKRPPAGYPADHPHITDLKRKDFFSMTSFSEEDVCAPDFVDRYMAASMRSGPLVRFLTDALDLPF